MKRLTNLVTCLILIFYTLSLQGQENKSDELEVLSDNGEYFKARELYQQIHDSISPRTELFYKYHMAKFMHKEDSAAIYMEKMLADYPDMFGASTISAYSLLFETYIWSKNYEKGIRTYERIMQHLQENPYYIDEEILTLWQNGTEGRLYYLKKMTGRPPVKLKRKNTKEFAKIVGDERLILETKTNGIAQKTIFDTGCDFDYIINRQVAKALGIKCDISEMGKGVINGVEVPTKEVTIDSLEVGNLTLYNITATIYENDITQSIHDSIKNDSGKLAFVDSMYTNVVIPTIGLPVMHLIGKFLIDYENGKVTFPDFDSYPYALKEPNLFRYKTDIYTRCELNGKDFVGILDTGTDASMKVDTAFYEKYQNDIPIDTTITQEPYFYIMAHQVWDNLPYKIVQNPQITFNNKPIDFSQYPVTIYSLRPIWPGEYFDGVMGYSFFKNIGKKVLLDLDNMRLEAIE